MARAPKPGGQPPSWEKGESAQAFAKRWMYWQVYNHGSTIWTEPFTTPPENGGDPYQPTRPGQTRDERKLEMLDSTYLASRTSGRSDGRPPGTGGDHTEGDT